MQPAKMFHANYCYLDYRRKLHSTTLNSTANINHSAHRCDELRTFSRRRQRWRRKRMQ